MKNSKSDIMNASEWERKLGDQSEETLRITSRLYDDISVRLKECKTVLDVGCGLGTFSLKISEMTGGELIGIDKNLKLLKEAKVVLKGKNVELCNSDAHFLPFKNDVFDLVTCTVTLMWVKDPKGAVNEMARVAKKGGEVLAALEPDYGGIIRHPDKENLARIEVKQLKKAGADPFIGRKLKMIFENAGLKTDVGISPESLLLGDRLEDRLAKDWWLFEKMYKESGILRKEIADYKKELNGAVKKKHAIMFVPCFYAIGKK